MNNTPYIETHILDWKDCSNYIISKIRQAHADMYKLTNVSVYWYCRMFLSDRSLISIEYTDSNDVLFEGTVKELEDTLDADLRLVCSTAPVKKAIPALCLRTGTPLSTCLMI